MCGTTHSFNEPRRAFVARLEPFLSLLRPHGAHLLLLGACLGLVAGCAPPPCPDPFDPCVDGGEIRAIATQADGKVIIGGNFTSVRFSPRNGLARFETDGSLDATFNPDVNGTVFGVVVQNDGKIIVGGYFTSVGGVPRLHLARIHPDGSLDPTYDPHPENPVYCMAAQPDEKLLIGGAFSTVGGAARIHLARLEESGLADPTFLAPAPDNYVTGLAVQPDGAILFGGYFHTVGSIPRNLLARVSSTGVLDPTFDPDVTGSQVGAMVIDYVGSIYISGAFTAVGGTPATGLARLNSNGTLVPSPFDSAPDGAVDSLTVSLDNRLTIAGDFTSVTSFGAGRVPRSRIARFEPWGSPVVDAAFNQDADGRVLAVAMQADGATLQGGLFNTVSGLPRQRYERSAASPGEQRLGNTSRSRIQWYRFGAVPEAQHVRFDLSTDGGATYTLLGYGSRYYVGISGLPGWELTGLSLPRTGLIRARARTTGGLWNGSAGWVETVAEISPWVEELDPAIAGSTVPAIVGSAVYTAVEQPDGKVVVAGNFTSVLGVPRRNAARLNADGSLDMTFDPSPNAPVLCAAVQEDGRILLGGDFTEVQPNGAPSPTGMNHLVRLDPNGTVDWTFVTGGFPPHPDAEVNAIVLEPDGAILLGGRFFYIAGGYRRALARLHPDGSLDALDAGIDSGSFVTLTSLARQPDGKIIIAGYFDSVAGVTRHGIARVEADGTLDPTFADILPNGPILSLALQTDGRVLCGGAFNFVSGAQRGRIMRLEPTGVIDTTFTVHATDLVWSMAVQTDERILAGGQFLNIVDPLGASTSHGRLARLAKDGPADRWFAIDADAAVNSLSLHHDGKIWLGGNFTNVDGYPRKALALIGNPSATNQLSKTSASRVEWRRGGTAPEASYVTFELSTDGGVTYSMLGAGTRIAGGWELTGLSLPSSGRIRGRARVPGGMAGGSSGLVETIYEIGPPILPPTILERFGSWAAAALPGRPSGDLDFNADPDHDGLPNGIEFYLGLNPAMRSTLPPPPVRVPGGFLFTYNRAAGFGGADATAVQWSTNLMAWGSDGVTATVLGPAGPNHEQVQVFVPVTGDWIFLRFAMGP